MSRVYRNIDTSHSLEKLKELDARFEAQLRNIRRSGSTGSSRQPNTRMKRWVGWMCMFMLLIALPFFVLVRTSVYLYNVFQLNGWLALAGGVVLTVLLLLVYALTAYYRMTEKPVKTPRYLLRVIAVLVLAYCGYGLLYLSGMNAKNPEVRSYYHSLHPILRITLSTITLADQRLVVTDTRRAPEDYIAMGLPVNSRSLHYMQASGYVHAVDIRTTGRPEWKNWLTRSMFWLSGLETNRHVGSADHLHVFLPLNH